MSEATTPQAPSASGERRTPEQEQAEKGASIPSPYDIPLEEVNPVNAHLFSQNRWQEYFERLRKEDPVHYYVDAEFGPFWSVTRYDDIVYVEKDPELFSSEPTIVLPPRNVVCSWSTG